MGTSPRWSDHDIEVVDSRFDTQDDEPALGLSEGIPLNVGPAYAPEIRI